jgi:GDP-mannose transporter
MTVAWPFPRRAFRRAATILGPPAPAHADQSPGHTPGAAAAALSPAALLACVCYAASSTVVTLLNKVVFSHEVFHNPWTLISIQNVLSVLLISLGHLLGVTSAGRFSPKLARDLLVPVVWFVVFIFSNAQSMRYINIPVLTVWKSVAPMAVALFERCYFGDRFSRHVYIAMLLIALSALVTAANDLEYSLVGYCWGAVNVVSNVAYLAALRIYLNAPNVSALEKTFHSNLLSLIPMVALAVASQETTHVLGDFMMTSSLFWVAVVASGLLTTAVCATAFWTISVTNGSTLSFVGGLNKVPTILISLLLFETQMSTAGWLGVSLGIFAGLVFLRAKTVSSPHAPPPRMGATTSPAMWAPSSSVVRLGPDPSDEPQPVPTVGKIPVTDASHAADVSQESSKVTGSALAATRRKIGVTSTVPPLNERD